MTNAWAMLYDILNDEGPTDTPREVVITPEENAASQDSLWKYNEGKILKELSALGS